jgi:8-oxo-dGTP pyrophosphatase MutT (NUDIX family)
MSSHVLDLSGPNPWTTHSSRVVFDNGRLRLRHDEVVQPDGAPGSYTYVELPWPVAAIVPLSDNDEVHLVRQWRYPWGRNSWEIPAGHGEDDETPLEAAKRELSEEVGLHAERWDSLGTGYSTASMTARYHIYLARNLRPVDHQLTREGSEGDLITCAVPLAEAVEAAMDGRIEHSLSIVALLRAARRLGV